MNNVLECQRLGKTFKENSSSIEVLRDVNLTIQESEVVAIVGASGAGKSTLLHLLGGLDKPTHGVVRVNGVTLDGPDAQLAKLRNKSIGFVFQFHHLLREFSAVENVMMPFT